MKISIITICKNEVKTIEKTLLSILNQTYKDFEIIIIDGVSTDGTLDVINKYKDKIAHLVSEPDSGLYNAMNKGIKLASGDLLYFLNANDTLVDENVFQKEITAFEKNPDVMMSFANVYYVFSETKKNISEFKLEYNNYKLFLSRALCHQTIFYKRELFEKYGLYDESYSICSDNDKNAYFLIRRKLKAMYLPFLVANFMAGGVSSSPQNTQILNKEIRRYRKKYYGFMYYAYKFDLLIKYFIPKLYWICPKFSQNKKMNVKLVDINTI